jgi:hypothetical protein
MLMVWFVGNEALHTDLKNSNNQNSNQGLIGRSFFGHLHKASGLNARLNISKAPRL